MPALLAIRDGAAVNVCPNLQALTDGKNAVVPSAVHDGLRRVFIEEPPLVDAVCRIRPEEEAEMDYLMAQKPATAVEEPRYDCGIPECHKSFPHKHVGIQTVKQNGLVKPEALVLVDI
jgi:hypothetical protein